MWLQIQNTETETQQREADAVRTPEPKLQIRANVKNMKVCQDERLFICLQQKGELKTENTGMRTSTQHYQNGSTTQSVGGA